MQFAYVGSSHIATRTRACAVESLKDNLNERLFLILNIVAVLAVFTLCKSAIYSMTSIRRINGCTDSDNSVTW